MTASARPVRRTQAAVPALPRRCGGRARDPRLLPLLALLLTVLTGLTSGAAGAEMRGSAYRADGRCGPYPRLPVETPEGLCVGLVAGPADGLRMPRAILEVSPRRFLVTDMGNWGHKAGRLIQMTLDTDGKPHFETLFERLDVPHGLVLGPDGRVYVGEQDEIWRFDPAHPATTRETVSTDFPAEGLHRLKQLVFDGTGRLIVNLGAFTDRCERGGKGQPMLPCPADDPGAKEAALWAIGFSPDAAHRMKSFQPLARGLRNSMALAVHPGSGLVLQGENNVDLSDPDRPPEELNVIEPGSHYGWPYCTGMGDVLPDYRRRPRVDCGRYERPVALLPAHSAPLTMLYYRAGSGPQALAGLDGRLLITLHGYRESGHRVIACETDGEGRPVAKEKSGMARCEDIVSNWGARPGTRPLGSPVGLAAASDGSLWLTEDKSRTVLVLRRSGGSDGLDGGGGGKSDGDGPAVARKVPAGWSELHARVLSRSCVQCHKEVFGGTADEAWQTVTAVGWADAGDPAGWLIVHAMKGEGVRRPMPPPTGIGALPDQRTALEAFLAAAR